MFPDRARALLEVLVCSGFPTQVAIAFALQAIGLAPLTGDGHLSPRFVFSLSLLDAAILLALIAFFVRRRGQSPRALFLGHRSVPREAGLGLALVPLTFAVVFGALGLLHTLFPWLRNVPENPLEALLGTPGGFVGLLVVAIVAGGLREEVQRAFLLDRFTWLGGKGVGIVVTSLAFGLGHTVQGWDAAIATGVLGLLWGLLYLARGSSVAPVVNHALFNTIELVAVYFS